MSFRTILQPEEQQPTSFSFYAKKYFAVYAIIIVAGVFFYAGYQVGFSRDDKAPNTVREAKVSGKDRATPSYLHKDVDFSLFWDVWNRLKRDYINKDTPDTQLFYGALAGIVNSLGDPYTVFLNPEMSRQFDESLTGSFDGIGAEIGMKKNQIVVIAPLADTPAERAGLRAGDYILAIDKKETTNMTVDTAVKLIRGNGGTKVTLTIFRDTEKKERDVVITRDRISIPVVTSEVKNGNLGYIKISHFNEETAGAFRNAVQSLLGKGVRGLVVDLRNNPGGYLDIAVQISGYWIDGKTVVIEQYSGDKKDEHAAQTRAILADVPTVILVNEGSASASEIVAGALQDYGKAKIVGKKTFGKGSVQDLQHLKDGSSLKITIAKWLTPKGRSIQDEGIVPDVDVAAEEGKPDEKKPKDTQLDRAIEVLKSILSPAEKK